MARKARAPSWLKTAEAREEWRRVRHQAVDAGALNIYLQAFDVHAQASREWQEHVDSGVGMIIVDQSGNVRANPSTRWCVQLRSKCGRRRSRLGSGSRLMLGTSRSATILPVRRCCACSVAAARRLLMMLV